MIFDVGCANRFRHRIQHADPPVRIVQSHSILKTHSQPSPRRVPQGARETQSVDEGLASVWAGCRQRFRIPDPGAIELGQALVLQRVDRVLFGVPTVYAKRSIQFTSDDRLRYRGCGHTMVRS